MGVNEASSTAHGSRKLRRATKTVLTSDTVPSAVLPCFVDEAEELVVVEVEKSGGGFKSGRRRVSLLPPPAYSVIAVFAESTVSLVARPRP